MGKELSENEILNYIEQYFLILNKNFDVKTKKKIPYSEIFNMMGDLYNLFNEYYKLNQVDCSKLAIKKYIPLLKLILKINKNGNYNETYENQIKKNLRWFLDTPTYKVDNYIGKAKKEKKYTIL